jgi:hypothetical protein
MNYKAHPSIKENRELRLKQKEALNQKFLKQLQKKSLHGKTIEHEEENVNTQQIKKVKKQFKELKKKFQDQKSLVNKLKKENRSEKKSNELLKKHNWELQQELTQLIKNYETKLNEQNIKLIEERHLKRAAEKEIEKFETERKKRRKTGNKQIDMAKQVKKLISTNKILKQRLENYDQLMIQEYGDYKLQVQKLQSELDQYKLIEKNIQNDPQYVIHTLKKQMTSENIPDLISLMEQFINRNNLKYFYRGQQNIFYTFMRRVSLLSYHSKKQALKPFIIQKPRNNRKNEKLGYLTREEEQWFFVDVNQSPDIKSFPVTEIMVKSLAEDCPAKAMIQDGNAIITKCFTWESPEIEEKPRIVGKNTLRKNNLVKEYNQFGNFKFLVLGSRYLTDYKNRLEMHGCEVEIHNPYEEGFELLKGKINRAEIILVCERHIPHGVWDYVDRRQSFVSVLKTDSKDLISTFAYLTLQRCELI